MARSDEGGNGLLVDFVLLETDPLIWLLDWRTGSDLAVALADAYWNMGNFPTTLLTALEATAEMLECLHEETLDVVRLQAQRLGPLHLEPQFLDPCLRHSIVGQRPPAKQLQQVLLVDGAINLAKQARLDVFLLAILDRLDQQVFERCAFEQ